jgi:uncharacterized protein
MSKILLFALLAFVVYLVLRQSRRDGRSDPTDGPGVAAETMVACARCGVNVPRSEVLESHGRFFCSEEHRALGPD